MSANVTYKSHDVKRSREGITASFEIICDWAEADRYRPAIGTPHPFIPELYCVEVSETGEGVPTGTHTYTKQRITVNYSSAPWVDTAPIETMEFSGEILETGLGRKWVDAGTVCDQSQGIWYPSITLNYQVIMLELPTKYILNSVGKVNWYKFMNCPAETLLFEGASTESIYEYTRMCYYYRVNYRFLYRPLSHNVVWRQPRQARDELTGALQDSGPPNYDPVFVYGPAGKGGWDRTEPPLYATTDFGPLFGWPMTGIAMSGNVSGAGMTI